MANNICGKKMNQWVDIRGMLDESKGMTDERKEITDERKEITDERKEERINQ
jgi:hypothetical protein